MSCPGEPPFVFPPIGRAFRRVWWREKIVTLFPGERHTVNPGDEVLDTMLIAVGFNATYPVGESVIVTRELVGEHALGVVNPTAVVFEAAGDYLRPLHPALHQIGEPLPAPRRTVFSWAGPQRSCLLHLRFLEKVEL